MSKSQVVYEISRFDPSGEAEVLVERVQLIDRAGRLFVQFQDGLETPCETADVEAELSGSPHLCEVHADQVTRITAAEAAHRYLPLSLRVPGDKSDFDPSRWSPAMTDEHITDYRGEQRDAFRVLYVNGRRWGAYDTTDGLRLMPDDDENSQFGNGEMPSLDVWARVTFGESASRTYGLDEATVGLATEGVVVSTWEPDELDDEVRLRRLGNGVDDFLDWLLHGGVCEQYYAASEFGQVLMVRLLAAAALEGRHGYIAGDYLTAGVEVDVMIGVLPSSEWTLDIELDPSTIEAVLDRLRGRDDALSEALLAVEEPQSLPGQRRQAAFAEMDESGG